MQATTKSLVRYIRTAALLLLLSVTLSSCGREPAGKTVTTPRAYHPYGLYAPGTIEELNPRTGNIIIAKLGLGSIAEYQDYTIGLVNDLGVSWVRMDFIYSRTGFFAPAEYLQKLDRNGTQIAGCIRSTGKIDDLAEFQAAVAAIVRDNPGIRSWQIENEPNGGKYSADEYVTVFLATRQAVKEQCPDCLIILAGAAIPDIAGTSDREYYSRVVSGIAAAEDAVPFDAIDLHVYGIAGDYGAMPEIVRQYREILGQNGYNADDVGLWLTETATYTGTPSQPPGYQTQTEEQQAADLIKRFTVMNGLGAARVAWSRIYENYQYARIDNGYYDNTGLIYNGLGPEADAGIQPGTLKKAFIAYRTLVSKTDGYARVVGLAPGQYRFEFDDGRTPVYVLWAEGDTAVPPELAGGVIVTDFAGGSSEVSEISLGYMPLFVEAAGG